MKLNDNDIAKWTELWNAEIEEALITATDLIKSRHYYFALFFCHLATEKKLKAVFLERKKIFPPPVHDLLYLIKKSGLKFSNKNLRYIAEINTFNIKARYDDYKREFYKKASKNYTEEWFERTGILIEEIK